jgi:hypothetical protein
MKFSFVVRASGCLCQTRHGPGFDPSILRNLRVPDEAMLKIFKKKKSKNIPPLCIYQLLEAGGEKGCFGGSVTVYVRQLITFPLCVQNSLIVGVHKTCQLETNIDDLSITSLLFSLPTSPPRFHIPTPHPRPIRLLPNWRVFRCLRFTRTINSGLTPQNQEI